MDKYNKKTAFQKWFSAINVNECSKEAQMTIKKYDYYHKKLDFQTTIKILLHAVYEELLSYREIGRAFMDERLCREVGIDSLSHRSLSRRWAEINTNILMEIFTSLVQKVSTQRPSSKTSSLQLIDSTTIPLNKIWFPWAKFRQTKSGIKLHLNLCYLDQNNQYTESFMMTNAKEQDRSQCELLVNKTEAIDVVDRDYFDYKLLDRLHNDGYFFVTRTKSDIQITVLDQIAVDHPKTADGTIISDQQVMLGGGTGYATGRFRLVAIRTKEQKILRIVTNRLDVSTNEVVDIYQASWQIEFFFKHLKQNLILKRLYSQSEQGAINQVILTLIALLLTYLVKIELNTTPHSFS